MENQDVQVQQALWSTVRFAGVSDAVLKKVRVKGWPVLELPDLPYKKLDPKWVPERAKHSGRKI